MSQSSRYPIPQKKGYADGSFPINDDSETSPDYFNISEFPTVVGGGRYLIKLKGGRNLKLNAPIDIEIIDAEDTPIFTQVVDYTDRFGNAYIYFDIYDITAQGLATVYIVGQAIVDPRGRQIEDGTNSMYETEYNLRWSRTLMVMPTERNTADLVFDSPPKASVTQVLVPARIQTQSTASSYAFTTITSSANLFTIVNSDIEGYDRDFASSTEIVDPRLRRIKTNPLGDSMTMNSVRTDLREPLSDGESGFNVSYTRRFPTRLIASSSFFKKEHLGGYFEFADTGSYPRSTRPALPTGLSVSGSLQSQFDNYNATIVEIISDTQAVLDKPLKIVVIDSNNISRNKTIDYTYKQASAFTGSITYAPTDQIYVTSSTVSQSYVDLTFTDLSPISGEVYRIKTSIKLGSINGEYKLLNDQIISPVEYLTDQRYPNPSYYSRHESEYRMIGHFVTESYLNEYWSFFYENGGVFDIITGSIRNNILADSTFITAHYTQSAGITTQYYQNYTKNQKYTLSFYLTLDAYTELEVYMGSDPLNSFIQTSLVYPRAFLRTDNFEKARYRGDKSLFGKLINKVKNDKPTRRYYGLVQCDFETDSSGLGGPIFRSKVLGNISTRSGSAHLAEISVKPYKLNGFTPNIVQYAVPLPSEIVQASSVSQSLDFKIEYFDYTGRQSEYTTFLDDVVLNLKAEIPSNTCQTDRLDFSHNSGVYIIPI